MDGVYYLHVYALQRLKKPCEINQNFELRFFPFFKIILSDFLNFSNTTENFSNLINLKSI